MREATLVGRPAQPQLAVAIASSYELLLYICKQSKLFATFVPCSCITLACRRKADRVESEVEETKNRTS